MILLFAVSGMSARYAFGRGNGQYGKCSETGTVRNYDSKRYWSAVVYRFGIYGLGFFLGYFIFSHDEVMERLEKCWLLLLVCALAVAVAGFAGAYLAYEIISRISVLRWLICGMGGKIFDIKPGDNLLVLGDEGQGLAIMKEQGLLDMLKAIRS